jgi:hypothetical protein
MRRLGQAKLGSKEYCKSSIHDDLLKKFKDIYLSKQVYFVADKQAGTTDAAKAITNLISKLNMQEITASFLDEARAKLLEFACISLQSKYPNTILRDPI